MPIGRDAPADFPRMKTYSPKPEHIVRRWYVIDASGQVLGRLASEVAAILRGKHKPIFAPHMDMGDNVIVINAAKIEMTGGKESQEGLVPPLRVSRRASRGRGTTRSWRPSRIG